MTNTELQRLRDLPIEGVAERLGLQVKHHKCLCPFHDDHTPSLSFCVRKNTYRCFVCGASGGTIDLVMNYLHKDFLEATRWLEGNPSISLPRREGSGSDKEQKVYTFDASRYERFFEHPILNEAARRFLYDERHLDPRVVRWCRLTTWTDKNGIPWLQIPYYNKEGKLIGIQNRNLSSSLGSAHLPLYGESRPEANTALVNPPPPRGRWSQTGESLSPRFRFPTGSRCSIYNLPVLNLLRPDEPLYITEGCSDCWAMLSSGHKAIAIPSATLLSSADKDLLASLSRSLGTRFHMYPDKDAPGERLFMQLKEVLPDLIHHQLPLGCKDFADYYQLIC